MVRTVVCVVELAPDAFLRRTVVSREDVLLLTGSVFVSVE